MAETFTISKDVGKNSFRSDRYDVSAYDKIEITLSSEKTRPFSAKVIYFDENGDEVDEMSHSTKTGKPILFGVSTVYDDIEVEVVDESGKSENVVTGEIKVV